MFNRGTPNLAFGVSTKLNVWDTDTSQGALFLVSSAVAGDAADESFFFLFCLKLGPAAVGLRLRVFDGGVRLVRPFVFLFFGMERFGLGSGGRGGKATSVGVGRTGFIH